jgi:hypothetical protein
VGEGYRGGSSILVLVLVVGNERLRITSAGTGPQRSFLEAFDVGKASDPQHTGLDRGQDAQKWQLFKWYGGNQIGCRSVCTAQLCSILWLAALGYT